jgi:hypothetical protein
MAKRRNDGDGSVYQVHTDTCPRPVNLSFLTGIPCSAQRCAALSEIPR